MTKWESPNDVLKQPPPVPFGTWGGLGILPPLQPPISSPLVKAGHVPLTWITSSGFKLITKSDSVKPWVQVALEVSPFRPLHPLPLDRRSSSRPVSTETPRSWSALSRVDTQIMVTDWKWGSPPAYTSFAIPWFLPHPWSTGCVPEAGIAGVTTLPTKVAVWPDNVGNWTSDLSGEKSAPYNWAILTTHSKWNTGWIKFKLVQKVPPAFPFNFPFNWNVSILVGNDYWTCKEAAYTNKPHHKKHHNLVSNCLGIFIRICNLLLQRTMIRIWDIAKLCKSCNQEFDLD